MSALGTQSFSIGFFVVFVVDNDVIVVVTYRCVYTAILPIPTLCVIVALRQPLESLLRYCQTVILILVLPIETSSLLNLDLPF